MTIWRQQTKRLQKDALVFYFVSKHPGTPWYVRCVAACSVAYSFSPVQLIPSFIPVIGFLDDFLVLLVGAKIVQRFTPPCLLKECRALADATEIRRNRDFGSRTVTSTVFVTAVWLAAAVVGSALIAVYIYH
jgi:uncharacterized membrane protein YkvA (DUF1232 family)